MSVITETAARLPEELTIQPGEAGYDDARRAWNLALDQRPAAIVRPSSADEVRDALRIARERGLRVTAQSTGHGAGALGSLTRTLMVRTDRMRGVELDLAARRVRVGAGVVWADVYAAIAPYGLSVVGGAPDVGVAGYCLGGGLNFLSRRYGLACNRVTAIELVTADGQLRRVNAGSDPELFWAVRGGGGNFGVVTALELELLQLREVYAGALWFPIDRAEEVLRAWAAFTREKLPDELATIGRLLKFPPLPELPEALRGQSFVLVQAYHTGQQWEADALMSPLRALGPVNDTMAMMPATEIGQVHMDPPEPTPCAADGMLLDSFSRDTLSALLEQAGPDAGFPLLSLEIRHLGGELSRSRPDAGALASLDAAYAVFGVTVTPVAELKVAAEHQLAEIKRALAPWRARQEYLNFADTPADGHRFWTAADHARLEVVKASIDPDGLIAGNHPIA